MTTSPATCATRSGSCVETWSSSRDLIDDLLDLTRLRRGKLTLDIETADAGVLLRDAAEICADSLRRKQLELSIECESGDNYVRGDTARLRQVLWNLFQNAAKFTPRGGRVIGTCATRGEEVVIEVSDTGAGIEPERLPTIFDAFEQGGALDRARTPGLGLGLAICKALVSLHGGTIEARSGGPGRGATFTVRLPAVRSARPSQTPAPPKPTQQAARPLRILLVEDHEDTALLMKTMLERRGHSVETADNVRNGYARAREMAPDVIISDLGLPDGTGLELLRMVRDAGIEAGAIALSGYGMEDDVRRSREAGFIDHLVKPVGIKHLFDALRRAAEM